VNIEPSIHSVRAAHQRISSRIRRTPILTSRTLDERAEARLYFKCENFQRTGSFKFRGASNALASLSEQELRRGVVTHSSGNHAAALALAAREFGAQAWIVMPSNAPETKKRAVASYGGKITECQPTLAAREDACNRVIEATGAVLIHPYNDARIIAGQGTAALEFLEEVPELDLILAPVSGGGLLCGTAISGKNIRPGIRVVGCEPANADDAHRSLESGRLQPMEHPDTIADGLRASLCPLTFGIIRKYVDEISLVSEQEIVEAMRDIWERMKIIIEPSSAVAAAPAILRRIGAAGRNVGVILSGGNVDLTRLPFS
jgi:threonine dehydratase